MFRKVGLAKQKIQNMDTLYTATWLLIAVSLLLLYRRVAMLQGLSQAELILNLLFVCFIIVGYFGGPALAIITSFLYVVWYSVYLATFAHNGSIMDYVRLFSTPMTLIAVSYARYFQRREYHVLRVLQKQQRILGIDHHTGMANQQKWTRDLRAHIDLLHRCHTYHFAVIVFKIKHIEFIREQLSLTRYYRFLQRISFLTTLHILPNKDIYTLSEGEFALFYPMASQQELITLRRKLQRMRQVVMKDHLFTMLYHLPFYIQVGILEGSEVTNLVHKGASPAIIARVLSRRVEEDIVSEYTK